MIVGILWLTLPISNFEQEVSKVLRPVVSSKQFGLEDFLVGLATEVCVCAKRKSSHIFRLFLVSFSFFSIEFLSMSLSHSSLLTPPHSGVHLRGSQRRVAPSFQRRQRARVQDPGCGRHQLHGSQGHGLQEKLGLVRPDDGQRQGLCSVLCVCVCVLCLCVFVLCVCVCVCVCCVCVCVCVCVCLCV